MWLGSRSDHRLPAAYLVVAMTQSSVICPGAEAASQSCAGHVLHA